MEKKFCENLWTTFMQIRELSKNGSEVFSCDDPKSLLVGWSINETIYCFRLSLLRTRSPILDIKGMPINNEMIDTLTKLIRSSEGRNKIAKFLSRQEMIPEFEIFFDRMCKLKAFW